MMTRREGLAAIGLSSLCPGQPNALRKPAALRAGDTVGLIAPATAVHDPDRLALARKLVEFYQLKVRFGSNVGKRSGYMGASIDQRVADLHEMFRDPAVKAIFTIRGGYGSAQLLDKVDYGLIAQNPKIFIGYSDVTALLIAMHQRSRLVTFHGPVATARFTDFTRSHFQRALFSTSPIGLLSNPPDSNSMRAAHPLRVIRPGSARGPLIGGNLTLISSGLGTPYEIDTKGKILFLEDVEEQPYSIDRMLTQLRLAGKLQVAAGIIFGECTDCKPRDYKPSLSAPFSLGEVMDEILGSLAIPVLAGLTIGHTSDQITLPLGVMAQMDADKGELVIEESATI
jgi:muramoyltetrapeptide carboxypeptidase